jgi:hypothetical protein
MDFLLDTIKEKVAYKIGSVNSASDRIFIFSGQSIGAGEPMLAPRE